MTQTTINFEGLAALANKIQSVEISTPVINAYKLIIDFSDMMPSAEEIIYAESDAEAIDEANEMFNDWKRNDRYVRGAYILDENETRIVKTY